MTIDVENDIHFTMIGTYSNKQNKGGKPVKRKLLHEDGEPSISFTVAHELGHVLGLNHLNTKVDNIMNATTSSLQYTEKQKKTMTNKANEFVQIYETRENEIETIENEIETIENEIETDKYEDDYESDDEDEDEDEDEDDYESDDEDEDEDEDDYESDDEDEDEDEDDFFEKYKLYIIITIILLIIILGIIGFTSF